jgi:hypothetical protein
MAEGPLPPDPASIPDPQPASADAHRPAGTAPPAPKKPRRRRRWPFVVGGLLLLLVLLVVLLPTLAGTSPVRSLVLGQVNQRINGRVEVADWSLGWTTPVSVSGLKVFDRNGSQILELPRLTTELKLLDAARGRLHFGKVTVDGLDALVRRDAKGEINFARLVPPGPETPAAGPTTLPDIRGELHLVNCRATFEDQLQGQTFFFPSIAGTVKCPDINATIENALEIACRVGDAPAGKLTVVGNLDVADGNVIVTDKMAADEKLTFQGVELGSFAFALGKDGPLNKLAGLTSGAVSLRFRGGEGGSVEAQLTSTGFAAGGPALEGDTFATQRLALTVPPTTIAMPAGPGDWKTWTLRVGSSGAADRVRLEIDQGHVEVGAEAPLQALANLADNRPPGAAGRVLAEVELDVGALAAQMPRALALQEGLTLSSGRFTHTTDLQLAPDRATVKNLEVHLTDVRGQRAGKPVSLQPIDLALTASTFGGGWASPRVRDLNLTLTSGFANAQFSGQDIAALSGQAAGDLKRLQDELGQIVDLGDLKLSGPFDVLVSSRGDVAAGGNATLSATVAVNDLVVEGLKDKPAIRQKRVFLEAGGEVVRRPDGSVDQLRTGRIVLNTGDPAQPTVAVRVVAPAVVMAPAASAPTGPAPSAPAPAASAAAPPSAVTSATYQIEQFAIDLPRAQSEFGGFVDALKEYAFDRGILNVTGGGKYEGGALTYDGAVALSALTLARTPAPAPGQPAAPRPARVEVLRDYNLTTDAAFAYAPEAGGSRIDVTKLSLRDNREMLALAKADGPPLRIVTTADGALRPSGKIELRADLKQLNDVNERLAAASAEALAPAGPSAELRSGKLAGTVELAQAAAREIRLLGNFEGSELTVAAPGGNALNNEKVTIAADLRARDDFSSATVDKLDVTGGLLTANVTGTALQLTVGEGAAARPATLVEMVQSAAIKADVPDLGKIQALMDAFATPTAPAAPAPARAEIVIPPGPAAAAGAVLVAQSRQQPPPPDQIIGRRPRAPAQPPAKPLPGQRENARPREQQSPPPQAVAGESAEEPAPPIKMTGGSASLSLNIQRQGGRVVITPGLTAKNVSLARGPGAYTLDAADLRTSLSFVPVPPPATAPAPVQAAGGATAAPVPSLAEQMRDVQVPSLVLNAAGSTITLIEPVVVSDLAGVARLFSDPKSARAANDAATVKAAVRASGDVGKLSALLVALGYLGDPQAEKQPYSGAYVLEQRLAGGRDGIAAGGKLDLNDFTVAGGSSFNEKAIRFVNDVTLDPAKDALSLRNITLAMESTKALELKLAGNVLDYSTQRRFENVAGTIGYDWAKLWEIVRPMLSKEQQESLKLRVAGQAQRRFAVGGSYPAVGPGGQPLPFHQAVRSLTGHFEGGFQVVEVNGLTIENLELPLTLRDGKVIVAYHDREGDQAFPPLASCNGGRLNVGGAVVDLTEEDPRLTMRENTVLLEGATLNPLFSDMFGHLINNPMFVNPTEARGLVGITVTRCERLPLSSLMFKNAPQNDGRAEFFFAINEVYLGNSKLLEALKLAGQSEFARSLQGSIRDSKISLQRGRSSQDIVFNVGEGERPLRITGTTDLETKRLNLTLYLPPQLLRQLGSTGRQVAELMADGLPVPVGGTTTAPQLDLQRAFASVVQEGLLPGLLRRATQRGNDNNRPAEPPMDQRAPGADKPADGQPQTPPPAAEPDPLKDLFDLVGKQRQQQEREKEQRREQRRREQQQRQGAGEPRQP